MRNRHARTTVHLGPRPCHTDGHVNVYPPGPAPELDVVVVEVVEWCRKFEFALEPEEALALADALRRAALS